MVRTFSMKKSIRAALSCTACGEPHAVSRLSCISARDSNSLREKNKSHEEVDRVIETVR